MTPRPTRRLLLAVLSAAGVLIPLSLPAAAQAADTSQGAGSQGAGSQGAGSQGVAIGDGLFLPPAGEMQVINPQAAYAPGEAVEFIVSGCSPAAPTRLELRNDLISGAITAQYPAPSVNVGGYVRAAAQLPTSVTSGVRYLLLSCTSPQGAPLTAAAQFTVVAGTWAQPAWPSPVTSLPTATTTTTIAMAHTGFESSAYLGGSLVFTLVGLALIALSRRRVTPRWTPAVPRGVGRR